MWNGQKCIMIITVHPLQPLMNRSLRIDILLDVDAQGARNIKDHFENNVLIYLLPPSLDVLESRLKARGTDTESILRMRLKKAANEIKECTWYDYIIINDDLEKAISEAEAIIVAERCRAARQEQAVKNIFAKYIS